MTDPTPGRRYGGKTAEERASERRVKLLDTALELFGSVGYGATTIEALCADASLNPRYFYEQFDTRESLLRAVYDRHVEQVLAAVLAAIENAPQDPRTRLEVGLRAFISATLADERAARVNYFELVGVSRELEARRREVLRLYAELITAQTQELQAPAHMLESRDPRLPAVALVGAIDGLIIDWMTGEGRQPIEDLVATLVDIFVPDEP